MRAFYIETIRIFSLLESNEKVNRTHRKSLIYFWMRGLLALEHRRLTESKELAQSDEYATKGFIGDYGVDYKRKPINSITELRAFNVTPYKTMDFNQLKKLAESKVKITLQKYHSNAIDMGHKSFFEVLHCFEDPPKWLCEILEFKVTYEQEYPDASFICDLIEIASFNDLFSD